MAMYRDFRNAASWRRLPALLACALALPGAAAAEDHPPPPPIELAPFTVHGQRNPLDESDRRLRALQQSLPGTDAGPKQGFLDWYLAHDDPNQLGDASKRQLLQLMGKNQEDKPPDLRRPQP
jgi:hypothetical protein